MDFPGRTHYMLVGDYILVRRIGSGSFATVWLARHRHVGAEVAIKEIDKKLLNSKVNNSLRKEITILQNIRHPNIIRLHDAIETPEKIYLVLEYCSGGDLATYIHRFGRVSEVTARHFMRQLASGLQILRENNLIHRDLKPQNLLLSSKEETPILKIGDFGFARYLMPQGLAETLCGSPLYMAPEIMQNQKYDAKVVLHWFLAEVLPLPKLVQINFILFFDFSLLLGATLQADLWSIGAILFQLVAGKPPFEGNSQYQLFQNIMASNELRFPRSVLEELHIDCIDLCRSLLRKNPVERVTFEEFFNHEFMSEPRPTIPVEMDSQMEENKSPIGQRKGLGDGKLDLSGRESLMHDQSTDSEMKALPRRSCHECRDRTVNCQREHVGYVLSCSSDPVCVKVQSAEESSSMSTSKVADSLEDYVLIHSNFTSMETLSSLLKASGQNSKEAVGEGVTILVPSGELPVRSVCTSESAACQGSALLATSQASAGADVTGKLSLNSSTRLQILHQYVHTLSELAQEKLNAQLYLESFSIELVVLAVWKEVLRVCSSWAAAGIEGGSIGSSSAAESSPSVECSCSSLHISEDMDFKNPVSVCSWAEKGFISAFDRAEKISSFVRNMDGGAEMPDAMEIVFRTALEAGTNGAVDELMENRGSAAASYSKATVLLSFILTEATSLPLNPRFCLSSDDRQRIQRYITNLKAHQNQSEMPAHPSTNQTRGDLRK